MARKHQPQAGNPAWKAAALMQRNKPGNINKRRCSAVTVKGRACRSIAITGWDRCYVHGGAVVIARRRLKGRRRLRHAVWKEKT
jgi:hypothetical protein